MRRNTVKNLNVFLLGLAFMLVFTAFQTMGNIQTTILQSASNSNSTGYVEGFTGDGFISLALIYTVFSVANWLAPTIVALIGPRLTLFTGGVIYTSFIAQISWPNNYLLYFASALIGFGAAIIWTAQGNFLTINSDKETMSRNSGIFWAMLQASMVIGNTFVFFQFQGLTDIDTHTRTVVTMTLMGIAIAGTLVFLILRPTPWSSSRDSSTAGPSKALKEAFRVFLSKDMLLLSVTNFYTGLLLTFWSGVYGPSIANTKDFGSEAKSLNGLHGIFVGFGEIVGGLAFGIFGHLMVRRGRDPIIILGFVLNIVAFFATFINLPEDAPMSSTGTTTHAFIYSNKYLAIITSFLLGVGDACFNTQIYSLIGNVWSENSAPAFAIFKFVQSTSAALAFFYSRHMPLYYQLLILVIFCIMGTLSFCVVEWKAHGQMSASRIEETASDGGGGGTVDTSDSRSETQQEGGIETD